MIADDDDDERAGVCEMTGCRFLRQERKTILPSLEARDPWTLG
jgi:hypothetical protein